MEAVLQDVPSDLGDVYHRILQSIEADPHKKMLAKSILTWVVLAPRPLSTDELRCAIKIDVGQTVQNIIREIPSVCGQLVFIDQSNKVQIIHETAREFLVARDLDSDLAISMGHAHTRLSLLLVRYLSSNALKSSPRPRYPRDAPGDSQAPSRPRPPLQTSGWLPMRHISSRITSTAVLQKMIF